MENVERINEIVIQIGQKMLECGAEIHRAEVAMELLLKKFNAEHYEVFTISSQITISSKFDGKNYTIMRRVTQYETNFNRLNKLNSLCREIVNKGLSIDEIEKRLNEILSSSCLPNHAIICGYVIAAMAFTIFFGGDFLDAFFSGILAILIALCDKFLKKRINGLVYSVFICFVIGTLGIFICKTGLGHNADKILIGDVMVLIPGITLTNSFRDLFLGDTISGIIRFIESLLCSICVALGIGLSIYAFSSQTIFSIKNMDWWITMLTALIGTFGFSIMFHSEPKMLFFTTLGSFFSWGAYLLLDKWVGLIFVSVFIAGILSSIYGEVMARVLKRPAIYFIMPTLVPLYPGASLFYSLAYYANGDKANFTLYLGRAIYALLGICAGVVLTSVAFKYLHRLFNNISYKLHNKKR